MEEIIMLKNDNKSEITLNAKSILTFIFQDTNSH